MKRRLLLALPVAVGAIAAWAAMTLSAVSAGPLDWPLAPATPVTKIYSDTFTPLSGAPDGQGIQNHRYMTNPVAAPNYFMPAGGYGHVVLVNSPDLSIGAVPMSAVSAEVCVELELNSTVRNEWARLYFGVQDKDQNVVHWTDPKTDEPFLILAAEDSQQCHTLAFPRPVKLVNHPHLVVAVELMLDSGSGAVLDGVTYTLQPTLGGDLTPTEEWQWPYVVGATIYPGTIQRAAGAPCYTLTYSDAFQAYTVYLRPHEITYADGGSPLPNSIPDPVAVDYVGPIDNYHYTLDFRYQGVSYSAPWYTSCVAPVPTLKGTYKPIKVYDDYVRAYEYKWYANAELTWTTPQEPMPVKAKLDIYYTNDFGSRFLGGAEVEYPYLEYPINPPLVVDGSVSTGCPYGPSDMEMCSYAYDWTPYTAIGTVWDSYGNAFTVTTTLVPDY